VLGSPLQPPIPFIRDTYESWFIRRRIMSPPQMKKNHMEEGVNYSFILSDDSSSGPSRYLIEGLEQRSRSQKGIGFKRAIVWTCSGYATPMTYTSNKERVPPMLYTIAIILVVLWLLGLVTSYTMGGFIHVLLVIAIIVVLVNLISGRRTA